jgi:hypothetical protein
MVKRRFCAVCQIPRLISCTLPYIRLETIQENATAASGPYWDHQITRRAYATYTFFLHNFIMIRYRLRWYQLFM